MRLKLFLKSLNKLNKMVLSTSIFFSMYDFKKKRFNGYQSSGVDLL